MALWNANTAPQWLPSSDRHPYRQSKRNVIQTPYGWVRRITYTDAQSNARVKDEILVTYNDLSTVAGAPDVVDMWHSNSTIAESLTALTGTLATHSNTTITRNKHFS
jgi:hypothetical protein